MTDQCTYKLIYFKIAGRGEPVRLLFHYAGQQFEDHRIDKPDWVAGKAYKQTCKYGQVPILEVTKGDKTVQIAQSAAILRYLAEKFDLMGKDEWEKVQADELSELCQDFHNKILPYKLALKAGGDTSKAREEALPIIAQYYGYLENALGHSGSGFLLASGPSYTDFIWAFTTSTLQAVDPEALQAHAQSVQHAGRVYALPQLQKYVQSLPADYLTQKM